MQSNTTQNSIEKITQQLQSVQNQLSNLTWTEKDNSPKTALSMLYNAQGSIAQALAQLCTLSSK